MAPGRQEAGTTLTNEAIQAVVDLGRQDLADRLQIAAARMTRPAAVVCVVGEFKQGKSSLINALLGASICPVDDDLATSVLTVVYYAPEPAVQVRRREGTTTRVERIDPANLPGLVTERGNPANRQGIDRVDVGVAHPLLHAGLTLVDSPGIGGLGAGQVAATLGFLPYADALIFVTDASAELSAPERDFLRRAVDLCPTVLCALTKIDIAPEWRRIADLDRAHMAGAELEVGIVPVSSTLRRIALHQRDAELDAESGFPALVAKIDRDVIGRAKELALERALAEVGGVVAQLSPSLRTELAVLEDPSAARETVAALEAATERLDHLRGPGARWSILVGDRMTELSNEVTHRFRGALRTLSQAMDERIETLKSPAQWEELGERLSSATADAVAAVFATLEDGARDLRREVVELVRDEAVELAQTVTRRSPTAVGTLWASPSLEEGGSKAGAALGRTLTGLRGAQSGILMLGMMGSLLPAAAAALVLSTPITLGLGVAFAGGQLLDANRRKIAGRRLKARTAVRQFLDDVQFEVGNQLGESVRDIQRELRDEFTDRVAELHRTYSQTAQRAQEDAQRDRAGREQRVAAVNAALQRLEAIRHQADRLAAPS